MPDLVSFLCAATLATITPHIPPPQPAMKPAGVIDVDLSHGSAVRSLPLPRGKSATIDLPVDVREVLVTNPEKVDAVLQSSRRITLLGQNSGDTDAVFFDVSGAKILTLNIRVDQDTTAIADAINSTLAGSSVRVRAINDSLILSGKVMNVSDADTARDIARAAADHPDKVVNALKIAGKDQVMVKVRIVEVQRSVIKQLGFNLNAVLNQVGEPQFAISSAASWAVNGGLLGGASAGYSLDTTQQPVSSKIIQTPIQVYDSATGTYHTEYVQQTVNTVDRTNAAATVANTAGDAGLNKAQATLQAFERAGLVRTLAEPNLTSVSGEPAKFLAGGEFPVPVGRDNTGKVTVEFKSFGVGLAFTPVVLSEGRISLKISTEMSELSNTGALTLTDTGTTSNLTVPGLNVRRAEATVELPSGGAMMIAGLLQQTTKQTLDSLPGMMTLPVLGTLFRSRDYQNGETEMVVIVTPYIVSPTSPDKLQTPADGLEIADDASTILMGKLNKAYKVKPAADARSYEGPHGYIID